MTGHTINCYRKAIRCKVCGETLLRIMKEQHLTTWRSETKLPECSESYDEEDFNIALDHGPDPEF